MKLWVDVTTARDIDPNLYLDRRWVLRIRDPNTRRVYWYAFAVLSDADLACRSIRALVQEQGIENAEELMELLGTDYFTVAQGTRS